MVESPKTLHIRVDRGRCVGNAMCVALAPDVFVHDELRQSTVRSSAGGRRNQLPEASREAALEAAANCPTAAIAVTDRATGRILFP